MSRRPLSKRISYSVLRILARLVGVTLFRIRCCGRQWEPASGRALVCANHQSYLDPVFVGLAFNRRLNYLARKSLFRAAPFRWLIRHLDAIPIDRQSPGVSSFRETLRRLKRGEMVLIFPEGTRSEDGTLQPFQPGLVPLVRRSRAPLVPVALDGAFDAWPRRQRWPRPAAVRVVIGPPISPEQSASLSDRGLLQELERRVRDCWEQARRGRRG